MEITQMGRISSGLRGYGSQVSNEGWPEVSNEEAELIVEEQANDLAAADAELDEVYRLQDVADKTEETADYIEQGINQKEDGATEGEVALAEQVADLATAGSDESAETVMPAVESYIGSKVSTEGFREVVRNIIETIKRMIKKIIERLKSFWRKMTSRLSALKRSAEDLKKRAGGMTGKHSKEKKFEVSGSVARLISYADKPVKNGAELVSGLRDINGALNALATKYCPEVAKIGEKLADSLNSFDPEDAKDGLKKLNGHIHTMFKNMSKDADADKSSSDSRFSSKDTKLTESDPILGGKTIFCSTWSGSVDGDSRDFARRLQSSTVFMADTKKDQKDPEEASLDVLTPAQVVDIAEEVIRGCETMKRYTEGKGLKDMEKAGENVRKAADKIGSRKVDEDKVNQENQSCTRLAVQYGSSYVTWTKEPYTAFTAHSCAVFRAAMAAGSKALSQYEA
ncbi:internal head protein [Erwinia phage PhiEaH1]|uniref:Virion structural protein n=1 Tax=Erwinia phage PhiEaH1 TaxID=1401669 RepID=W8CZQ6_9CAUD|nr:internal head protein [Erwinia phage PhiEaH1]AGX01946.1 hypothetical protein [Erwinia phage PhiEaH1]